MIKNLIIARIQMLIKSYYLDSVYSMRLYKIEGNSEQLDGMFLMILQMKILQFAKGN